MGKIIVAIIVIFIGVFLATGYQKGLFNTQDKVLPQPLIDSSVQATVPETKEVHSSDGAMNLIMQTDVSKDGTTTYSFSTEEASGENEKLIFVRIADIGQKLSLPQNAWSPDNKYFFIYVLGNDDSFISALVLKATGENLSDGEKYIDVAPLFVQARKSSYALKNITGWDSQTLLHVKTTGPTFWFDVGTLGFIQLASR